jgi:hypothetical protein
MPLGPTPIVISAPQNPFLEMLTRGAMMAIQQNMQMKQLEMQAKLQEQQDVRKLEREMAVHGFTDSPDDAGYTPEDLADPEKKRQIQTIKLGDKTWYKAKEPGERPSIFDIGIPGYKGVQLGKTFQIIKPEPKKVHTLGENQVLLDETGNLIAKGPPKTFAPQQPPAELQMWSIENTLRAKQGLPPLTPSEFKNASQRQSYDIIAELNQKGEPIPGTQKYHIVGQPLPPQHGIVQKNVTTVNVSNMLGMEKTTKTDLEKDLLSSHERLSGLISTVDLYDPDFLTFSGKTQAALGNYAEKMGVAVGPGASQFLTRKQAFDTSVMTDFNSYRKEVTGAASSYGELNKFILPVFPNPDMGQSRFEGAMARTLWRTMAIFKRNEALLRRGLIKADMLEKDREGIYDKHPLSQFVLTPNELADILEPRITALLNRDDEAAKAQLRIYDQIIESAKSGQF